MTCFEFRKLLLVHPSQVTLEQQAHAAQCVLCARAAADAAAYEARLQETALVPVPDALADRVLLRHSLRRPLRHRSWAMAAVLLVGVALGVQFYSGHETSREKVTTATALPSDNPAVAAISFVLDYEPRLLKENRAGDPGVMHASFQRLGLKQPSVGTTVRYLGKCPVPGGTGDHVVLTTPYGAVTLILVPDYPVGSRVMVADRQLTAVANPVRSGGYIIVADSPHTIRQVERMLM